MDGVIKEIERQWITTTKVGDAFRQIESAVGWIEEVMDNFAVGLATMAMERLPATLFPPLQVQAALKEIKSVLPSGWSLSPSIQKGDVWKVYTEAKVFVAAVNNVISLPRPIGNATQGAQFYPLSPFLAVAIDRQAFVELSADDAFRCLMSPTLICPISSAINRKHRGPGCAYSLIVKDKARSRYQCATHVSPCLGQQTVYLSHRRWGYSTTEETTITIPFPQSREKCPTRRAMIQGRVALLGEHLRIIEEEEKARRGAGQPETCDRDESQAEGGDVAFTHHS
ncbi:hypothetical protein OUZ56_010434 [Daphnia magna]|uniref:Uncharacterized protein n=1 Tax=Daphnia magna TaxID=35525 RepID=A0ABR0AII7_9CRUS|nr:hypothetical protein OUZ56_010434 [Daphnia magna]